MKDEGDMSDEKVSLPKQPHTPHPEHLSPRTPALLKWRRHPVIVVFGLYILALIFIALFANFLAPHGYATIDDKYPLQLAPSSPAHPLGTDNQGFDVLSRLIYGVRISLTVAVTVVLIELLIGIPLGLIAGYYGGRSDQILMRVTDVMFAFPDILLAILLRALFAPSVRAISLFSSLFTLFLALGLVGWPALARLVRGQTLALREKEFIEAARAIGVRPGSILRRHILPNLLGPLIVQATQDMAGVILAEATLSFLNIGVPPPFPSWGRMINDALPFMRAHPLLLFYPGFALALTVMAFNFLGDALRDALDPRLRK